MLFRVATASSRVARGQRVGLGLGHFQRATIVSAAPSPGLHPEITLPHEQEVTLCVQHAVVDMSTVRTALACDLRPRTCCVCGQRDVAQVSQRAEHVFWQGEGVSG